MRGGLSTKIESHSETSPPRFWRPIWRRSLLTQLAAGNILILFVFGVVVPISVSSSVVAVSNHFIMRELQSDLAVMATTLQRKKEGWRISADPDIVKSVLSSDSREGFAIIDRHGRAVAGSSGYGEAVKTLRPGLIPDSHGQVDTLTYVTRRMEIGPDYADVVVYQDLDRPTQLEDKVAREIALTLCLFVGGILAASQLVGMLVLFLTTRGVRRATREASLIGPDNLDQRISTEDVPEDISGLVQATNAALDRVEEGYRLQGRFADAVSHELRTPIAVLRLKCEMLPDSAQRDELIVSVDRMTHILSQLMALASLEGAQPDLEMVDLVEVVRDIATDLVASVHASGRSLEYIAPMVPVAGRIDVHYMTTIIGNLVGNAVSHTQPGSHIVVGVEETGVVYVNDDGPGMILHPGSDTLQPRYLRADKQHSSGSGLGLRIVTRSVDLMGCEIQILTGVRGSRIRISTPQT
ncbi:MAG: HAMP domain-containing sensor histidine kinase [Sphingobium sp.]